MNEHDKRLISEATYLPWWEIKAELAETQEGYDTLHALAVRKYHYDEFKCGML